jgi:hypothetical protein
MPSGTITGPGASIFGGLCFFAGEFSVTLEREAVGRNPTRTLPPYPENIFRAAVVPAVYFIAEGVLF